MAVRLTPGDPFAAVAEDARITPETREQLRQSWQLDKPVSVQYLGWLKTALTTGNLGLSLSQQRPVTKILQSVIPPTLALGAMALGVGLLGGTLLGVWQFQSRGRPSARRLETVLTVFAAIPDFVLGVGVLALLTWIGLAPGSASQSRDLLSLLSSETVDGWTAWVHSMWSLAVPSLVLGTGVALMIARVQYAELQRVEHAPSLVMAVSLGASPREVFWRYLWPLSLGATLDMLAILIPAMCGGVVVLEQLFRRPGLGSTLVGAVAGRDAHLIVGAGLVGAFIVVSARVAVDALSQWYDPRAHGRISSGGRS